MNATFSQILRRSAFLLAGLTLVMQMFLPMTAFAVTTTDNTNTNDWPYWCSADYDGGVKFDNANDATIDGIKADFSADEKEVDITSVDANKTVELVVVKAGSTGGDDGLGNEIYNTAPFDDLTAPDDKEISHVIVCYNEDTPDTTVEVVKQLLPGNDSGLFNLKIDGTTHATDVGDAGTTGEQTIDPDESVVVAETAGTNTSLTDYTTMVSCINQDQVVLGSGERTDETSRSLTINKDDIEVGDDITCTFTNTRVDEEIDYCDPTQKPGGMSIAQWLAANQIDGSDCFDYEPTQECGSLDVVFTKNLTPYNYSFRYVIGDSTPALADYLGDGALPVAFSEDENGGSVEVTYYIVGPEKDYFVGFGMPNIWDGNGVTVEVDTDCEEPKGSITVVKDVEDGEDEEDFEFEPSWGQEPNFFLDDDNDGTLSNSKTFDNLDAGDYTVTEVNIPDGWELEDINCESELGSKWDKEDDSVEIELKAGDYITCTFENDKDRDGGGEPDLGKIFGHKFNDVNGNGVWDNGEGTLEGFEIELYSCDSALVNLCVNETFVTSDTTDENGLFEFTNITPGPYWVCEVQQNGWTQTLPANDACWLVDKDQFVDNDCEVDFGNKADEGQVLGDSDVNEPDVLVTTGSELIQSVLVAMAILGSASGVTYFSRKKQFNS